jgi:NAD(P) transhydrogenase subunit alpha
MKIGVLKEALAGEIRVWATPATVGQLLKLGYDVVVASSAGVASSFADDAYVEAGAAVGDPFAADVLCGVNPPSREQLDRLKPGSTVIALLSPMLDAELVEDLAQGSDHPRSLWTRYHVSPALSRWMF